MTLPSSSLGGINKLLLLLLLLLNALQGGASSRCSTLTSARPLGPNTTRATTATRMASGAPTPRNDCITVCKHAQQQSIASGELYQTEFVCLASGVAQG
jgi:hypothetical protein